MYQKNTGGHSKIKHGHSHISTPNEPSDLNFHSSTSNVTPDSRPTTNTWVRNISKTPLTEAQEHLLAHGPNFAAVPRQPPIGEYVVALEKVCQELKQGEAEELRGEIKTILKNIQPPKSNISKEEVKALNKLKKDNTRLILTTDKGVSMVVMDREEYIQKSEELLSQSTYKTIPTDPTTKFKNKLISLLKTIKAEGGINETIYRRLYSIGAGSPKFYGLPKVHKEGMALRPIISSIGSVTYETAQELPRILKPLVGKSPYHVQNTKHLMNSIEGIQLKPDQCIMSYDVKALFTSVPIQPAINIIKETPGRRQRTTPENIHDSESHLLFI